MLKQVQHDKKKNSQFNNYKPIPIAIGTKTKKPMKKVVLRLSQFSISARISFARSVILQMTGNVSFSSPTPTLAGFTNAVNAAETAMNIAVNGTPADTADMYAKVRIMETQFTALAGYVEYIANQSGNPQTAIDIILSAGMQVKKQGAINIPILAVTALPGSAGVVKLRRKAIAGSAYVWQFSENQTDWTDAGESTIASFTIAGLESLKRYYFRVATIKRQAQSEWSDTVTFVVS